MNMVNNQLEGSFFFSSLTDKNQFQSFPSFKQWFTAHCKPEEFRVETVRLDALEKWCFDTERTRLAHESGRFFSIEGIHVETNFNGGQSWDQPIINQPEIGILGFITKVFNGVRYFLMQVKMEPGNINTLQISPSLQATKSNFTMVHKGKRPAYLEFFNGEKRVKVLTDCLQTEQGGRFLRKRNRNIVIEIEDDIEVRDEFCWLTMYELKKLIRCDNVLNMDTRSVLSTIPLIKEEIANVICKDISILNSLNLSDLGKKYVNSYITNNSCNSIDQIVSWYTQQKVDFEMSVTKKSLSKLEGWRITDYSIENSERYFSVIGVKVSAGTREVSSWMQPLIKDDEIGMLAFAVKEINNVLHFLVQAKAEPGNIDIVELSPSVSCSNYEHVMTQQVRPFLFDEMLNPANTILYDNLQSEEGGRFFKVQNRNMIVLINKEIELPSNYIWMTLRQAKEFMRYGMFNIEARSIISSIAFTD